LKELGKELGLAHSTVSGIVDRLGQKGLVERKTDEADLRFTRIVPTEAVRNFLKERWPSLESQPLAEALGKASGSEQELYAMDLRRCGAFWNSVTQSNRLSATTSYRQLHGWDFHPPVICARRAH
jgi:DNA-binding MarR family transcriptional regulator